MSEIATEPGLKRKIGLGLLTFYGVGVMVGAGIYVLVGAVAGEAGVLAPVAFLLAGLVAAPTAISYAELSARIPESAGEAAYVRQAFGRNWPSVLVGLSIAAVGVVSSAAILQGGVGYLVSIAPLPRAPVILGFGALLTGVAIWGVVESLTFAAVLTCIEVLGLLIVAAVGLTGPVSADWSAEIGAVGVSGVTFGAILAFFAFIGFEDMVNMAEETRDPGRTMPRAIFIALGVTSLLYALVSFAAVRSVAIAPLGESQRPLALVFETATGSNAAFLALIAFVAALNGVLAQIVMSARVLYGLGRRNRGLRVFGHAHPKLGAPVLATLVGGGLATVGAATLPLLALAEATSVILLVVFVAMNAALIALKRRGPPPEGVFEAHWIIPWIGAATALVALATAAIG